MSKDKLTTFLVSKDKLIIYYCTLIFTCHIYPLQNASSPLINIRLTLKS